MLRLLVYQFRNYLCHIVKLNMIFFIIFCADHHHIFVGDLAPETTSEDLKNYFGKIAEVS